MKKKNTHIGCLDEAKREAARKRAARAIAEWLRPSDLALLCEALNTAMDDAHEWSKYSDEGDDRREHEADMLARLLSVADAAQDFAERNLKKSAKE